MPDSVVLSALAAVAAAGACAALAFRHAHRSRARELLLRAALDGAVDAFFLMRAVRDQSGTIEDFEIVEVNRAAEAMWSTPRRELKGKLLRTRFPGIERLGIFDSYVATVELGAPYEAEFPTSDPSATVGWVRLQVVRAGDGIAVFARDITDRRRALESLDHSERTLREVIDGAALGIAVTGLDGTFRQANPALCALLGRSRQTLEGRNFAELTHPDDLPGDREQLARLLAGEQPSYTRAKRYRRDDGSWVRAIVTVSLVRDENGEPAYFVAQMQGDRARREASAA